MKTKDLIQKLQKADPTGEEEVCVNNQDILEVYALPAYYDGDLEVLIYDPHQEFPVGGKIVRTGRKIQITPLSLEDAGFDYWSEGKDFPIEVIGADSCMKSYEDQINKWKKSATDFMVKYGKKNNIENL